MDRKRLERKLAAILYADVAGYSRLTGEDEEGTHHRLSAYLDAITVSIENHHGKVLHYAGDAVLADFGSAVKALSSAVEIQHKIAEYNKDLPEDRRLNFRIGLNLGDVIVDRNEIYGDGVNVAARLQTLAQPGGICISESARTAVGKTLPLDYQFLGEQQVKNIAEPVRAYQVRQQKEVPSSSSTDAFVDASGKRLRRLVAASLAAVALVIGAAVVFWLAPWTPRSEPVFEEEATFPAMPDKPSIAVLPFANLSNDPKQEYFSDGITDDLITDLSKVSGLFVISRNSSFTYKGQAVKVQDVAQELGVHYVLEGSVRRVGDRVRINAQLIDATTGGHLWAERYDGALADVFTLQDKVTANIVSALKVKLTAQEQAVAAGRDTPNVAAYDTFLRGWEHLLRKTPADAAKAVEFFEQAVELDPNFSRAYAALAQTYWDYSVDQEFNSLVNPALTHGVQLENSYVAYLKAWRFLQKAQGKPSSQASTVSARMLQLQRRFDGALEKARKAVALGPSDPAAYDVLIENLIYAGETEEALSVIDESIRLDPSLPGEKLFLKGMAYYTLGRLEEAVSMIDRARSHNPKQTRYAAIQAAALAELGQVDEAKAALEDYLSGWTTYAALNWAMFYWPFQRLETLERLANAFIGAGLTAPLKPYYLATKQYRLTGEQIKALISNKRMIGVDRSVFSDVTEFQVTRDQNAQIVRQGYLNYFRDGEKTRIENDLLCDPWRDLGDYCVAIYRNPGGSPDVIDEYLFFTLMGTFSFSVFDSAS